MATKTRRWEARVDEETDALAVRAAYRLGVSKSEFITTATRALAERTLARADVTFMADELFIDLVDALDEPDAAPELDALVAQPRRFRRASARAE